MGVFFDPKKPVKGDLTQVANSVFLGETDYYGKTAKAYRQLGEGYKYFFLLEDGSVKHICL
ncbi:hypothetical protein QTG56_23765 (plasmid) [Rossellomorea sp. AcN35-11]|nr:hypothetical protein [Rossellomorea aquimaris]WJV32379.1 hypothetical protein QTG56_23765 [Rossellomorea sp. AcN35-11]